MRRVFLIVPALLALLSAFSPARVQAQTEMPVIVLGLRSMDGDDEFARSLSGVLRHAASQVRGWAVSPRDVSLAQMLIANGCDDADVNCLGQIARGLHMQGVVFGTVRRSAPSGEYTFDVALGLYNSSTNSIDRNVNESLPRTRIDVDDLRAPARRYALMLSGQPAEGSLLVRAPDPNAQVTLDGQVIPGTGGQWIVSNLSSGSHHLQVTALGRVPFTTDVNVVMGEQTTVSAPLPNVPPQTEEVPVARPGRRDEVATPRPIVRVPAPTSNGVSSSCLRLRTTRRPDWEDTHCTGVIGHSTAAATRAPVQRPHPRP